MVAISPHREITAYFGHEPSSHQETSIGAHPHGSAEKNSPLHHSSGLTLSRFARRFFATQRASRKIAAML